MFCCFCRGMESPEEKGEGGCGQQEMKYLFFRRLNWLISFNHSSEDLSFHIWKLNSEMCNYAFPSFKTKAEMTDFTTFHMLEKHCEDSGRFFLLWLEAKLTLGQLYIEGTTVPGVIADTVIGWAITAGSYCRNREQGNGLSLGPSLLSESLIHSTISHNCS